MINTPNPLRDKSYAFAIEIVFFYRKLIAKKEYVIGKQLLKSGTSIGANVREGLFAQSKPDFIAKLSISLKEAHETEFWLQLIEDTQICEHTEVCLLVERVKEVIALLTTILKTSRMNMKK